MGFIATKFCEICDEYYDLDYPECPGCASNKYYNRLYEKFTLAFNVIKKLPKCDKCHVNFATRYELLVFDNWTDAPEHIWRCDNCNSTIPELDYADNLRKFMDLGRKEK